MKDLAEFLRAENPRIIEEWLGRIQDSQLARGHSTETLEDHIPEFLDKLTQALGGEETSCEKVDRPAGEHAWQRYELSFDLRDVVEEYRSLRRTLMQTLQRWPALSPEARERLAPVASMHEVVDEGIAEAVERYADATETTRRFATDVLGHDLRNPAVTIAMAAHSLLRRSADLDPSAVKLTAIIASSADRMVRLISDLVDYTRTREGELPLDRRPCDLSKIVDQAVREHAIGNPGRDISWRDESGTGDFVGCWDPDRLAQVVSNLVSNGIEHGGDPIEVLLEARGDAVELSVWNAGALPSEAREHLFQPFVHARTMVPRSGLGLGLFIVAQIVHAHHGEVSADTEDGRTVFRVCLPRELGTSA